MTDSSPVSGARAVGLRTQILLMLAGAMLPLALLGLWLTASARRGGEQLLQAHLEESANRFAAAVRGRWEYRLSDLLLVAGNEATQRVVRGDVVTSADSVFLDALASTMQSTIPIIELRDMSGAVRWQSNAIARAAATRAPGGGNGPPPAQSFIVDERPVLDERGVRIGSAVTQIALSALIPPDSTRPLVPGAHVGVRNLDAVTVGVPLTRATPYATDSGPNTIDSQSWRVAIRRLSEPHLEIAIGAPTAPYVAPFERVARLGTIALIVVGIAVTIATLALATRATRALRELAVASSAIAEGRLQQQVSIGGPAEVRHVGAAFNAMSAHLRRTLDELSRRSALAAVGEFAASLSHDVRNALTAIRVDLERAEMRGVADAGASRLLARALANVARLESVVTGALRVARGGHMPPQTIDLRLPLQDAIDSARGAFAAVPGSLIASLPDEKVPVSGDAAALQQLFANLLFNAAQALRPGGRALVQVTRTEDSAAVTIFDNGSGISPTDLGKIADSRSTPFFSTKPSGTGLGLPIARQIAAGHGGSISIESDGASETIVRVLLPLLNDSFTNTERSVPASAEGQPAVA